LVLKRRGESSRSIIQAHRSHISSAAHPSHQCPTTYLTCTLRLNKADSRWGELCPMRFSRSIDAFHILPAAAKSYDAYSNALISIAKSESATLFIPVSGAGSSVEDARAAETMSNETKGRCRTFIQDPETMLDLHDKDRFMALVERLGFTIPSGKMVASVDEAIVYLRGVGGKKFVLKCMGLDENRGDMTLFPISGDGKGLEQTKRILAGLNTKITKDCPYVFQEYIPGPGKSFALLITSSTVSRSFAHTPDSPFRAIPMPQCLFPFYSSGLISFILYPISMSWIHLCTG